MVSRCAGPSGPQAQRTAGKHVFCLELCAILTAPWDGVGLTYQDESFINNNNTPGYPVDTRIDAAVYYEWSDDSPDTA